MAKVAAFYTSTYLERYIVGKHREVYHDQSECQYGKEIKRDGNDLVGEGGHPHCKRCIELET